MTDTVPEPKLKHFPVPLFAMVMGSMLDPGFNFNNQPLGNSAATSPLNSLATRGHFGPQVLSSFDLGRTDPTLGYGGLVISGGSDELSILPWESFAPLEENMREARRRLTRDLSAAERTEFIRELSPAEVEEFLRMPLERIVSMKSRMLRRCLMLFFV